VRRSDVLPAAGALALVERRHDARDERERGHVVAEAAADSVRLDAGRKHDVLGAAARPERAHVVRRAVAIRAAQAVAGDGGIHQTGTARLERRPVEPQLRQRVGPQVGDEHVRARDQPLRQRARLGVARVEHDALLAAVVEIERRALRLLQPRQVHEQVAAGIAFGRLDLHHVGAPVGEHSARPGPGDPDRELHHAHPAQHQAAARSRPAAARKISGA
jgi:hypothetical protein